MRTSTFCISLSTGLLALTLAEADPAVLAQAKHQSISEDTASILRGIDESVQRDLENAWRLADNGHRRTEVLLTLCRRPDGSMLAISKGLSGHSREFTFSWTASIIAVVHTHRNSDDPGPSKADRRLADRFRIPVFTMTSRGMYVYDPLTKKIVEVHQGLDWLKSSKWRTVVASLAKSR